MVPVVMIAAVGRNGEIGLGDALPWRLPGDLGHFRAETMGKPVVMGRKTFATLRKPLPGRFLIVVSRDPALEVPEGVESATSVGEALWRGQAIAAQRGAEAVMVAGGAEIYRAALDRADALCLSEVDLAPEADTFFPRLDPAVWREVSRAAGEPRDGDEAEFAIVRWRRQDPLR